MSATLNGLAGTMLLALTGLSAASPALAGSELETCQGGYSQLLMTPGECRTYLRELRAAESRADFAAMLEWQAWHSELLIERAQACPCHARQADLRQPVGRDARLAASGQR